MGYYDDDDDYEYRKRKRERKKIKDQREVIRYQELSHEEIKKQGGELLSKILASIPKNFNKAVHKKDGIYFSQDKQKLRISLATHPIAVVHFVVEAFRVKNWTAEHSFSDVDKVYDFLILSLPEDWLKRVLGIGRYRPVTEQEEQKPESQPEPEKSILEEE
jgi:hypothetical protein